MQHYLTDAAPTRHDPLPDFSEAFYLAGNPDVAALVAAGVFRCGYDHYLRHGAAADRAPGPWLDPAAYRAGHAEVGAAVAAGQAAHAFAHALGVGAQRGLAGAAGVEAASVGGLSVARARSGVAFHAGAAPRLSVVATLPPRAERALGTLACVQGCAPPGTELFALVGARDRASAYGLFPGATLMLHDDAVTLPQARNQALDEAAGELVLLVDAGARLPPDSLAAAIRCMDDPSVGAVGGPVLDVHGRLFGAGGVVSSDGARRGYMRGATMEAAEAGFARDVDYCSSGLLLVRAAVLAALGGFAEDIGDADAADAELCLRIWQSGYRVAYHPRIALVHADPRGLRAAAARRDLAAPGAPAASPTLAQALLQRHPRYVERRLPPGAGAVHSGRTPRQSTDSVLVIAPTFHAADTAKADLVPRLVQSGADVTVFPLDGGPDRPAYLPRNLPDGVEVITGVGEAGLPAFLAGRQGCFSRVEYMTDAIAARLRGHLRI